MAGKNYYHITSFLLFLAFLSCAQTEKWGLPPHDFVSKLQQEPGQLIDLRNYQAWAKERIGGAVHLYFEEEETFKRSINRLNRKKVYYLYCENGNSSMQALEQMQNAGFTKVYYLNGGIRSLLHEGYSVAGLF